MEQLFIRYGYTLLFLGVAVEGETFLLAASFLAHRGYFSLPIVIVVAALSNWTADQIYYAIARSRGRRWLEERFGKNPRYPRLLELMGRHGDWLLLISRFAFGFRIIIPAACGATGMPPLRFTGINFLAGFLWAIPTALLGYYFSTAAEQMLVDLRRYEFLILGLFLGIALLLLLYRHVRKSGWIEDIKTADVHLLIPYCIGFMGLLNLVSAIWPRSSTTLQFLESWFPLEVTQRSRSLMLFAGMALMQLTHNLSRRKALAWYMAVLMLVASLLLHTTRALDLHHSLVAGLLLIYLILHRHRFNALSDPLSLRRGLLLAPILVLLVFVYAYIGLSHMQAQYTWFSGNIPLTESFRSGVLIVDPQVEPLTPHAARFLGSVQIAGWLARLYLLILLLRPVVMRQRQEAPREKVDRLFQAHGHQSLAAFAVQDDKHHLLTAGGRGLVGYATRGPVALSCGDPIAPAEDLETSLREYLEHCRKHGWTPCLYEAAEENLQVFGALKMKNLKIAEEALLDLKEFSLAGGKRATLRAMVHKMAKLGMAVQRYDRENGRDALIDEQLEEISEQWLAEKSLSELGFTMGRFSLEALDGIPVFIALQDGKVHAFCSWIPYQQGQAAVLDLMRKRKDAISGTMDILISHSLLRLKELGFTEASLANAPLASVSERTRPLEKGVGVLYERMNSVYGYKNLFQFKKKFAPRWRGRFLIYPGGADLLRIAYALTSLHRSGGWLELLLRR